jgi:AcrR family transcriptional regulator
MPPRATPARRRPRAPRGTLNRDVIVKAAITVIDTDGLSALTTARLADELGVRPMSLYAHFQDKDAILKAVAAELFGRFRTPEQAESDLYLLGEMMRAYFTLLVDHPVLLRLGAAVEEISPAEAQFTETLHACLQRMNIDHLTAVGLVATMLRFVVGSALLYPIRRIWDEDPNHWDRISRNLAALPPETYPALRDLSKDFPHFTQREAFEFGLRGMLIMISHYAERKPGA